jgi:acyl carrier protein
MGTELKDASTRDRLFEIVRAELLRIRRAQAPGFDGEIRMDSSLIADLGLDSLSLVEAVVALEQALRIEHLSLSELSESEGDGGRFTVESLVDLCMQRAAA